MADLNPEGTAPANPTKENNEQNGKTKKTTTKPADPELKETGDAFKVNPSVQGNELVAIVRLLAGINKNLAFLAGTIYKHLNPEVKDGRPSK